MKNNLLFSSAICLSLFLGSCSKATDVPTASSEPTTSLIQTATGENMTNSSSSQTGNTDIGSGTSLYSTSTKTVEVPGYSVLFDVPADFSVSVNE